MSEDGMHGLRREIRGGVEVKTLEGKQRAAGWKKR